MICSKCGAEIVDSAKFCSVCGNPISAASISVVNRKKQEKPKKSILKRMLPWGVFGIIVIVCLGFLINSFSNKKDAEYAALNYIDENYCSTFGDDVSSIVKTGRNHYVISYAVNQDYDFWKSTGTVELSVHKDAGEWIIDVKEDNIDYHFEENDNWYYITASGNREFLVKMVALSENEVALEYYGYDMGSYGGRDDYDHETIFCDLRYDGANRCFAFSFMGDWRINDSYIGYNRFEVGAHYEYYQSAEKFSTLKPVNPSDYWWYENAKRQTGDYGSGSAVDISQAEVGDILSLGKYEMDNNSSNGMDDISWRVIDENEKGILVISEYCIAKQETSSTYETWENSVARGWLNGEFYNNAFTTEEKDKIITSTVVNDDNADTGMDGGNDTEDKLFLLSIDEANKYFASKEERKAYGTLYLQKLVGEDEELFSWWLRTPGKKCITIGSEQIYQSYVGDNGFVYEEGCTAAVYNNGLRPAMWLSR